MATLFLDDELHRYELDGKEVPSVSRILRFLRQDVYADIRQDILDDAAKRGTSVHEACETLDKSGTVDIDDGIEGYVRAYVRFLREHNCEWSAIESPIANRKFWYAGKPDRVGIVDEKLSIVDIKAQSSIHKTLVKAQLNAYKLCFEDVESLFCLQLMRDGKYRLYDVSIDASEFMSCLVLHNALSKKHRRGKIE